MFIELLQVIERNKPLNQQFKDGKQLADFYLELLGLKYLKVEYDILFDNKNIKQLSPGERGALLIIFYLLIDKGDIPLIIDQPEDNLDNESVFEYLVPYIKQAKQRRQIIIVTHNPNIAVVADAEQVIYTELDKANGNQIKYITGAIEDKEINKQIVKVLEGTMPAFDNRTVKYYRN
jgi:ABC-type lipoprotein export system ATPase subunit